MICIIHEIPKMIMKKTLLLAVCALVSMTAFSQSDSGFGLKVGLNYNSNGNYIEAFDAAVAEPDKNVGFHAGFFGKIKMGPLFLRPELIYSLTKSNYTESSFEMSKIDAPILLGVKIIGPVHAIVGPAFQYIVSSEFDDITIDNIDNDFSVGLHFGVGVNLGNVGIDVRYERGFNDNEARFINSNITSLPESRLDTRPEQIILSFSFKL